VLIGNGANALFAYGKIETGAPKAAFAYRHAGWGLSARQSERCLWQRRKLGIDWHYIDWSRMGGKRVTSAAVMLCCA